MALLASLLSIVEHGRRGPNTYSNYIVFSWSNYDVLSCTEVCAAFHEANQVLPKNVWNKVLDGVKSIEEEMGRKFGDLERPLLVSVRSGAAISMPGHTRQNQLLILVISNEWSLFVFLQCCINILS